MEGEAEGGCRQGIGSRLALAFYAAELRVLHGPTAFADYFARVAGVNSAGFGWVDSADVGTVASAGFAGVNSAGT